MDDATKQKVLARLKRIGGQVAGIGRMVEHERQCGDLLIQVASARAALSQANKLILRSHIEACVADLMASTKAEDRRQKMDELMDVFARHGSLKSFSG